MDLLAVPVVAILARYAPDKGLELGQEVAPIAAALVQLAGRRVETRGVRGMD